MAIKELFQDSRPQVLFDPRASQRIDPRLKFTRDGAASYFDRYGVLQNAAVNQPRFEYDSDGEIAGLLVEPARTNILPGGRTITSGWINNNMIKTENYAIAPDGTQTATRIQISSGLVDPGSSAYTVRTYKAIAGGDLGVGVTVTFSVFVKPIVVTSTYINPPDTSQATRDVYLILSSEGGSGSGWFNLNTKASSNNVQAVEVAGGWWRVGMTKTTTVSDSQNYHFIALSNRNTATQFDPYPDGNEEVYIWGAQSEVGGNMTSYIDAPGSSTVSRAADLLSIEGTSLPSTGSVYIDARSLSSNVDDTLLSAANASDDKLTLAIRQPASLYNSKALVYEVDGAFKPTLPFPVPTNARERNLITYGANNYHYRSDSSRYTPSSSTSVPASMTRLGIGHDVTDPTKAFTGYVNTVYLWPGEITPTVAEALVRGDLDPKDADAGVFTPETGALAFVFNTQGTATDGDKVVELPFGGSTNNVLVDWGDNTSSSFIGAAANSTVSHTYPSAGIYPVQITADNDGTNSGLENLEFYNDSPADLVRVLQWGGTTTWQPTTMYRAFRDCTQMDFETAARTNLPDTSAITNWQEAFYNCSSLSGLYPNFDHSAATTLRGTWFNCSSITSFGSSLNDISTVTDYYQTWEGCSSINSFPIITIPTEQGPVSLSRTWRGCSNLTSAGFPFDIDTSAVTNFQEAWYRCTSLTYFSTLDLSNGTNFIRTWFNCTSLTSFTITNFTSAETLASAFYGWPAFTGTFPQLTTSTALKDLGNAWKENNMTVFNPPTVTSQVTNMSNAWRDCEGLTVFPASMDTSACENFYLSWDGCSELTSFPSLDFDSATSDDWVNTSTSFNGFRGAWLNCSKLATFPANMFDNVNTNNFYDAFKNCALTTASIENIIVSIAAAASTNSLSNGYLSLDGGTNAAEGTWTAAATTALGELEGLGWTVDRN